MPVQPGLGDDYFDRLLAHRKPRLVARTFVPTTGLVKLGKARSIILEKRLFAELAEDLDQCRRDLALSGVRSTTIEHRRNQVFA